MGSLQGVQIFITCVRGPEVDDNFVLTYIGENSPADIGTLLALAMADNEVLKTAVLAVAKKWNTPEMQQIIENRYG